MAVEVDTTTDIVISPKKDVDILKIIEENVKGYVKWYNIKKNYGFISRSDENGDVFVHRSVISRHTQRFPSLRNGEEVEFSVVETEHGLEAHLVTGPGGKPVKGHRPFRRIYSQPTADTEQGDAGADNEHAMNAGGHTTDRPHPGWRNRGPRRRGGGGFTASRPGKDHHETENGDGPDPADDNAGVVGDSPNFIDPRQRRHKRRPQFRNRSAPNADGAEPGAGGAGHPQSDSAAGENPPRLRQKVRRPRPVNGDAAAGEVVVNGNHSQPRETGGGAAGDYGPRRRGQYRGPRRRNSKSNQSDPTVDSIETTTTTTTIEEVVVATEQCHIDSTNDNNTAAPVVDSST